MRAAGALVLFVVSAVGFTCDALQFRTRPTRGFVRSRSSLSMSGDELSEGKNEVQKLLDTELAKVLSCWSGPSNSRLC